MSPYYGRTLLESVVEPALRSLGAVMVAPDCGAAAWLDCETTVLALLDALQKRFNIDPRKTVLTGYSKGGIGTWALASRHPDRFRAAIIMAGRPDSAALEVWRTPLYLLHGRYDEIFSWEPTQAAFEALRGKGIPVELNLLDNVSHYDMGPFVDALGETAGWLETVWGSD